MCSTCAAIFEFPEDLVFAQARISSEIMSSTWSSFNGAPWSVKASDTESVQAQGLHPEQPFEIDQVQESAVERPNLGRPHSLSRDGVLFRRLVVG